MTERKILNRFPKGTGIETLLVSHRSTWHALLIKQIFFTVYLFIWTCPPVAFRNWIISFYFPLIYLLFPKLLFPTIGNTSKKNKGNISSILNRNLNSNLLLNSPNTECAYIPLPHMFSRNYLKRTRQRNFQWCLGISLLICWGCYMVSFKHLVHTSLSSGIEIMK